MPVCRAFARLPAAEAADGAERGTALRALADGAERGTALRALADAGASEPRPVARVRGAA